MTEEALEGQIEALSQRKGDSSGGVVSALKTLSLKRVRGAHLEVVAEAEAGGSPQSEASLGYRERLKTQMIQTLTYISNVSEIYI